MLPRVGVRSSALARAQAQLSGKRVPIKSKDAIDEHQAYMNNLNKKKTALKGVQSSFDDLSDISASEQETERDKQNKTPAKAEERPSRFLKKKQMLIKEESGDSNSNEITQDKRPLPTHAHTTHPRKPDSAALRRLEEIENRHKLRKPQAEISENDSDMWTSDERPFSTRSSSDFSPRGKRFMKKIIYTKEQGPGIPRGGPVEISDDVDKLRNIPKTPRSPSPPSKGYPRRSLQLSPPSHGSPKSLDDLFLRTEDVSSASSNDVKFKLLSLDELFPADGGKKTPRSPSPPSRGSPRRSMRQNHLLKSFTSQSSPPSQGLSRALLPSSYGSPKSIDELFPTDEDVSSASSDEFKLNILSSDDLFPTVDEKNVRKEIQTEKFDTQNAQLSNVQGVVPKKTKSKRLFSRKESSSSEESISVVLTETSGSCEKQPVKYERRANKVKKVTLKDVAVQTRESGFTFHQPHGSRTPDYAAETFFNEPVALADYTVSPELIEALSTNRSMAVALNDMLKQQLHLTRSFVNIARQMYLSSVNSLEREVYHYTTLEETKEYIRQQTSPKWKQHLEVQTEGCYSAAGQMER
ncbi:uncharacterized protein C19orf44 homolog [Spea bombifrons]|uniref:uncharacterized protein C19orf44 homolog n=1 Tax=Spea bombifrons TaxID=233779 RepID=UPI00234A7BB5|nr:uncharacterized protein C19orf44 homolog [Spea bombifrons]